MDTKDSAEMYKDRRVYVFPDGDKMRIFAFDGEKATEYPPLRLREVREQWKNGETDDEDILRVIHELD